MRAWHFMADKDGKPVLRDGSTVPAAGKWLNYEGHIEMCKSGLHASKHIIDALKYAPGPWCALVELAGDIAEQSDKMVGRRRKIILIANVDKILHEFACCCAVMAMERSNVTDERSWQAVDIKLAWLHGMASDEDLAAAGEAAGAASGDASGDAAMAAAGDAARAAAGAAARAAAGDAARAKQREIFIGYLQPNEV